MAISFNLVKMVWGLALCMTKGHEPYGFYGRVVHTIKLLMVL